MELEDEQNLVRKNVSLQQYSSLSSLNFRGIKVHFSIDPYDKSLSSFSPSTSAQGQVFLRALETLKMSMISFLIEGVNGSNINVRCLVKSNVISESVYLMTTFYYLSIT